MVRKVVPHQTNVACIFVTESTNQVFHIKIQLLDHHLLPLLLKVTVHELSDSLVAGSLKDLPGSNILSRGCIVLHLSPGQLIVGEEVPTWLSSADRVIIRLACLGDVHIHISLTVAAVRLNPDLIGSLDVGDLKDTLHLHSADCGVQLLLLLQLGTGPSISREKGLINTNVVYLPQPQQVIVLACRVRELVVHLLLLVGDGIGLPGLLLVVLLSHGPHVSNNENHITPKVALAP